MDLLNFLSTNTTAFHIQSMRLHFLDNFVSIQLKLSTTLSDLSLDKPGLHVHKGW